jgi:uncharacterized protein YgfB (UPF0149 family)
MRTQNASEEIGNSEMSVVSHLRIIVAVLHPQFKATPSATPVPLLQVFLVVCFLLDVAKI